MKSLGTVSLVLIIGLLCTAESITANLIGAGMMYAWASIAYITKGK